MHSSAKFDDCIVVGCAQMIFGGSSQRFLISMNCVGDHFRFPRNAHKPTAVESTKILLFFLNWGIARIKSSLIPSAHESWHSWAHSSQHICSGLFAHFAAFTYTSLTQHYYCYDLGNINCLWEFLISQNCVLIILIGRKQFSLNVYQTSSRKQS